MKYIFTVLCSLITSFAFTQTLDNIEYHLPKEAKDWTLSNDIKNEKGATLIYTPQQIDKPKEAFGVTSSSLTSNIDDIDSLKSGLSSMLPSKEIIVQVLEKTKDGVICEWSAYESEAKKIHGWIRAFSHTNSTSLVIYYTENISDLANARSIWLPVLQASQNKQQNVE